MSAPVASGPIYKRVALIGLGLIASSMAHAMRADGLAGEIVGHATVSYTHLDVYKRQEPNLVVEYYAKN